MKVSILGTRGIPANHGGFETFAEHCALYLVGRGHEVTVYCQSEAGTPTYEDHWQGIRRVTMPGTSGPFGTILFDWTTTLHALKHPSLPLVLGYNTAIFSLLYWMMGRTTLMNMDGIEWHREKWTPLQRRWLRLNEWLGAKFSDHLIADHPEIGRHLEQYAPPEKISVIPYEAQAVTDANPGLLSRFDLQPGAYAIVIARPEPENSLLDIVQAFSRRPRGMKLVVLGRYLPETNVYHRQVLEAAGPEVLFPGALYDVAVVHALRFFARVYLHGHRVGGTNPSLVESLAAGNPVIAHDNRFTRWVAGPEQQYFSSAEDLSGIFDRVLDDPGVLCRMAEASRERHAEVFTQAKVLGAYEDLLLRFA